MKKKPLITLGALLTASLALAGCSAGSGNTSKSSTGYASAIHFPITSTIPGLDPQLSVLGNVSIIDMTMFQGLVAFNANYVPEPELASSWTTSSDGLKWTFHLRQDVTFQNGQKMTSADVVASLNRWAKLTPRATAMLGGSTFVADGPDAVTVTLSTPRSDLLAQLANPLQFAAIMPANIISNAPATGVTDFVGTGPYKFVSYKPDQTVHVTRFTGYKPAKTASSGFAGAKGAATKDIYFDFVPDANTRLQNFTSGSSDFVDPSADTLAQVKATKGAKVLKVLASDQDVVFNKRSPLFSNLDMRKAVNSAIDSDDFMLATVGSKSLYRLNPSYVFKENSTWYSVAGSKGVYNTPDLNAAKADLKAAGYKGQVVKILTTHDVDPYFYNSSVILQSELKKIGVKSELDIYDFATLLTKRADPTTWDIYSAPFSTPATPTQILYLETTYGWPDDPTLAKLLMDTASAESVTAQKAASAALEKRIWSTLTVLHEGDIYNYFATTDAVQGFVDFDTVPILWNTKISD